MTIFGGESKNVTIGTKLKLKGGVREWEYVGIDSETGKVLLRLPGDPSICIAVNGAEVDWETVKESR